MLKFMGIEHRRRADGSVAVLYSHVEQLFGGQDYNKKPEPAFTINL